MRFLVDECTGPAVATWLRKQSHDVFSIYDYARGLDDDTIIHQAFSENWILITNDKDFGEKIFRENHPHHGVVLLRLDDERARFKIKVLDKLLKNHAKRLSDQFAVVTETNVRFGKQK